MPHIEEKDLIINPTNTEKDNTTTRLYRGDIYTADLGESAGVMQSWVCHVVIVQNDIGNKYSKRTIVVPIIDYDLWNKAKLPTQIEIRAEHGKLRKDGIILCDEIRAIDIDRLKERITTLSDDYIGKINYALKATLGLEF